MGESSSNLQKEHENSGLRKLLDSPFLILIISLLITFISYSIWGTVELMKTPVGVLPGAGSAPTQGEAK